MDITKHHTIQCPQCGGSQFKTAEPAEDWVTCATCGQAFPLDDIREAGIEQAKAVIVPQLKEEVERRLKEMFKGKLK